MRNIGSLMVAGRSGFDLTGFCIWAGAFALVLVVVFIVVVVLRKRFMQQNHSTESGFALTIKQIEEMHTKGMISDEEFAAMRCSILGVGASEEKSAENKDAV